MAHGGSRDQFWSNEGVLLFFSFLCQVDKLPGTLYILCCFCCSVIHSNSQLSFCCYTVSSFHLLHYIRTILDYPDCLSRAIVVLSSGFSPPIRSPISHKILCGHLGQTNQIV